MNETALLLIDLQSGNFTMEPPIYQGDKLLTQACSLLP